MTDDEIIRLLEARQEEGLSALSEQYGTFCRQIVLRLLPQSEDAEEVVNDVWLRAWEKYPSAEAGKPAILSGEAGAESGLRPISQTECGKAWRERDSVGSG